MTAGLRSFETERLSCEALGAHSGNELAPLLNDPLVARTLTASGRPPAWGLESEHLARHAADWDRDGFGLWLLRDRVSGELVGRGGLQHTSATGADEVEIAYAIVPRRWGEGLATELATACRRLALERLELNSVIAFTLTHNLASRRVMEKAGLAREREFVHVGLPHVLYRAKRHE